MKAHLALADGFVFTGSSLDEISGLVTGEVVFSTATTGYTEVLTDPSYFGQILVLSNPEIGNYGVNKEDFQSEGIKVKALVVRKLSSCASSYRSQKTLRDWLKEEGIPVLIGVDTRALITHIREQGAKMASLGPDSSTIQNLLQAAHSAEPMTGKKLSQYVAVKGPIKLDTFQNSDVLKDGPKPHVVVLDFGIKKSMLTIMAQCGARLTLMPGDSSIEEIWAHGPDGIFISNGPGDPKTEREATHNLKSFIGKLPIFGVCLGHQILAQALGFETFKLKYGHRGSNQAVRGNAGNIITTAQNHGFAVMDGGENHQFGHARNISDGTNEGLFIPKQNAMSVQFHPEGSPGPLDARYFFEEFRGQVQGPSKQVCLKLSQ